MITKKEDRSCTIFLSKDVQLGKNVKLFGFNNLYGCKIGDGTRIGTFVEIQKRVSIGKNCKISSHTFICEGVRIANGCFVGHGVIFINDKFPKATNDDGSILTDNDWNCIDTVIGDNVSIGSGAIILCGITVGKHATIGAGAVVTNDVKENEIVAGVPARSMYLR